MTGQLSIQSNDYWVKTDDWETWVLIEPTDEGAVRVHFINDEGGIFDELVFSSFAKALEALKRNGFSRYVEDALTQSIYRPPSPPFHQIFLPNLLCSVFWPDTPVSEKDTLEKIAALFKKYEPGFFRGGFKSGVRGRADPLYSSATAERLKEIVEKGLKDEQTVFVEASIASTLDMAMAKDGAEADPRINWRVTAIHGDYYIHVMALDQGLSRFACCLQSVEDFEESLKTGGRSRHTRYQTGNLAELAKMISDFRSYLKAQDERRRQQEEELRLQDRIDTAVKKAVERERDRFERELASERTKRLQIIGIALFVACLLLIAGINEYFDQKPGKVFEIIVGATALAAVATGLLLYLGISAIFWIAGSSGKVAPRTAKIGLVFGWMVFFALWSTFTYLIFMGWV